MKKNNSFLNIFIALFLLFFLILITYFTLSVNSLIEIEKIPLKDFFTIGISVITLVPLVYALIYTQQTISQNYDSYVLEHIEKLFISDNYKNTRIRTWEFWTAIKTDPGIEKELISIIDGSLKPHWGRNRGDAKKIFKTKTYQDYTEAMKLIRYFDIISRYSFSKITAPAIVFYYDYYRDFFKYFTGLYRVRHAELTKSNSTDQVEQSFFTIVERLDKSLKAYIKYNRD